MAKKKIKAVKLARQHDGLDAMAEGKRSTKDLSHNDNSNKRQARKVGKLKHSKKQFGHASKGRGKKKKSYKR